MSAVFSVKTNHGIKVRKVKVLLMLIILLEEEEKEDEKKEEKGRREDNNLTQFHSFTIYMVLVHSDFYNKYKLCRRYR